MSIFNSRNRIELLLSLVNEFQPNTFAEIGVWRGDFAAVILRECPFIRTYLMIDPWNYLPDWNKPLNISSSEFSEIYRDAIEKTRFASNKIEVLRGRTKDVVDSILNDSLDFVYIDGDHTLRGITIDLIKIFPKVKSGGYIAGDDFTKSPWQHTSNFEPTLVCPFAVYFAEAMNVPIAILPHNQFLIRKDSHSGFAIEDATGEYNNFDLKSILFP